MGRDFFLIFLFIIEKDPIVFLFPLNTIFHVIQLDKKLELILGDVELLKDCELRKVLEKAKHLVRKLRNKEICEGSISTTKENRSASPY